MKLKIGDTVKLVRGLKHTCPFGRENNRTAKVDIVLPGGEVRTDRDLRGSRWWNITDLEKRGKQYQPRKRHGGWRGELCPQCHVPMRLINEVSREFQCMKCTQ